MNKYNKTKFTITLIFLLSIFAGCSKIQDINENTIINEETGINLNISFTDPSWDGLTIPEGQQCKMFEGNGYSPEMLIENIPLGTELITISYNDRTFKANDNGGHGIVSILVNENENSILVPTFPGESYDLPENISIIEKFRSTRGEDGAYLPPCSGGNKNEYYISFKAIDSDNITINEYNILAEGEIEMGVY